MGDDLTIAETASRLGVSTATVFRMLKKGTLPRTIVGERSVRIPASAIKSARPSAAKTEKAIRAEAKASRPQDLDSKIARTEAKLARLRQRKAQASGGFING